MCPRVLARVCGQLRSLAVHIILLYTYNGSSIAIIRSCYQRVVNRVEWTDSVEKPISERTQRGRVESRRELSRGSAGATGRRVAVADRRPLEHVEMVWGRLTENMNSLPLQRRGVPLEAIRAPAFFG